jgi:hypothetical protein
MKKEKKENRQTDKWVAGGDFRWPAPTQPSPGLISVTSFGGAFDLLHQMLGLMRCNDRPTSFRLLPSATTRATPEHMTDYLSWVFALRYSTHADRKAAGSSPIERPGRGNRPQAAPLMLRTILTLKFAQCGLSRHGKKRYALLEQYQRLDRPLYWTKDRRDGKDRDGDTGFDWSDIEKARERLPHTHSLRSARNCERITTILMSFIIGKNDLDDQSDTVRWGLRDRWKKLEPALAAYIKADESIRLILHFFNLSQHTDADLGRLVEAVRPDVVRPLQKRLEELDLLLAGEVAEVRDQIAPLMKALSGRSF